MAAVPIYQLSVGDEKIDVHRKRIKHIYLAVSRADGRLKVTAPLRVGDATLAAFVLSKQNWITRQRANLRALHARQMQQELQFISGENHFYRGESYLLNVVHQKSSPRVAVRDNSYIDIYIRHGATLEQRQKILTQWYRDQLRQLIPPLIEKWQPVIDVEVKEWSIKQMKTRWGTCNINAQRIWLNLELIKKPINCLEYVVVHEMVHLLERHHNARFKAYMDGFLPEWREYKLALNHS
ncbi:M48 family metallopeptidase [Kaarinaea lacus]